MKADQTLLGSATTRLRELTQSPYSDFYRRKYADSEVVRRILKMKTADDQSWREVPFLTREEVQSVPYNVRLFVSPQEVGIMRLTSGTSGRGLLLMPRINEVGREGTTQLFDGFFLKRAFRRYASFSGAQYQYAQVFKELYGLDSIHLDPGNMKSAAVFVERYQPDIIAGFAYAITALYPHIKNTPAIQGIRAIHLFGERCSSLQWELFHEQFPSAEIIEDYASVDAQTTVGFPCEEIIKHRQQFVHPIPEYVYAEVIDPDTGAVCAREGDVGELVITVLRSVAMPLIRYRTGDSARIISESCSCGAPTPILSIEGRIDMDKLRFAGGELNLAEVERVFRSIREYLTNNDFEVHYSEVRRGDRTLPEVVIHMQWNTDAVSASRLAGIIATRLRVLEDKTYDLGVRNGEFEPLSIKYLPTREVLHKHARIIRDDP